MNIGSIDTSATQGTSWLHGVSPRSKLLAFSLALAAIVVSFNLLVLAALVLVLAATVISARLKPSLAFGLAAYPAFFAIIFAFASAPGVTAALTIVTKAVGAALAAVVLVLTTPYPQVFAPVQRVTPSLVGDSLLMTYRSTFLLLEKFSDLLRAVRLRSGVLTGHPGRAAADTTRALGGLLLYSLDLAQRDYDIMRVRGYEGRLRARMPRSTRPALDVALIAVASTMLVLSALWRVEWRVLNPYSWLPLVPAALFLLIALIARWRSS